MAGGVKGKGGRKTDLYLWGFWWATHIDCETSGADPLHVWNQRFHTMPPSRAPLTEAEKAFDDDHQTALWIAEGILPRRYT